MKKSSFDYEKRKRLLPVSVSDYITVNVHCEHLFEQTFHINFDIRYQNGPGPFFVHLTQTAFPQSVPAVLAIS